MSIEELNNMVENELAKNDIEPSKDIFDKLLTYYNFLVESNKKTNLTSITEIEEVYKKHFIDSIAYCETYKYGATLCDIGTGAGFPGVVLKIVRPDLHITLVDSLNKRVDFLNSLINLLNLDNIIALHCRAEDTDFKNKYLNSFDYVVARAVANLTTLTEYCLPFVRVGGNFIAYKSQDIDEELADAKKCISTLGGEINTITKYNIFENGRSIVIIDKIKPTNSTYPRGMNKPRLKPIR